MDSNNPLMRSFNDSTMTEFNLFICIVYHYVCYKNTTIRRILFVVYVDDSVIIGDDQKE